MENNGNGINWKKEDGDRRTRQTFWTEGKIVLSIFIAGIGLMFTIFNIFLNPIKEVQKDIALIQQDINTIQLNHEQHIQDILSQIKDLKEKEGEQDKQIQAALNSLIRLETMHIK